MSHGGGGDNFGMMVIMFLVVLFVIWMWMGGAHNTEDVKKPYIKPYTDASAPLKTYDKAAQN